MSYVAICDMFLNYLVALHMIVNKKALQGLCFMSHNIRQKIKFLCLCLTNYVKIKIGYEEYTGNVEKGYVSYDARYVIVGKDEYKPVMLDRVEWRGRVWNRIKIETHMIGKWGIMKVLFHIPTLPYATHPTQSTRHTLSALPSLNYPTILFPAISYNTLH